jgi:hypothetical protein
MIRPLPEDAMTAAAPSKTLNRQRIVEAAAERRPGAYACGERDVSGRR